MKVTLQGAVTGRSGTRAVSPAGAPGAAARYAVTAISAGVGNGLRYPAEVLAAAVPLFEGAPVFVDHAQLAERWSQTGGRSVRNVLGVLEHVFYDQRGAICGELRIYPGPDAEWFTAMVDQHLVDVSEGRASPRIGLSAVLDVESRGQEVMSIQRVVSVDAVYDPARGGEFIRALNQRRSLSTDRSSADCTDVGEVEKQGVEQGQEAQPPRGGDQQPPRGAIEYEGGKEEMAEEEVKREVVEEAPAASAAVVVPRHSAESAERPAGRGSNSGGQRGVEHGPALRNTQDAPQGGIVAVATDSVTLPTTQGVVATRPAAVALGADVGVALSEALLDARLSRANLPDGLAGHLRAKFGGRVYNVKELDAEIEALQAAWAKSIAAHVSAGVPAREGFGGGISSMVDPLDRLQAVTDKLCGLAPKSELLQGIRPVSGIRELYLMLSGDYDFRGIFDPERVALANITTSTMTSLVKNAFNKVILDYFNLVDRWWEPIVSQESFGSMQDLTLITLGGFGDLPTVSEGAAYTELSWSDSEEVVSFVKKGGYVGVTLEMMDKDETRTFRAIPRKLAIAGYRTLSAAIANLFTANSGVGAYWPSSQSTYRLFDSTYGNLGSSALSASTWDACIQAMYKMTEATSSERMGIRPAFLVVPIELEKTALTIMDSAGEPGTGDNDVNPRRGSSRVVVCPEMTDANDWLAVADPRVWPGMMVGFRFGSTPEVFIADQDTVGSMFTNDEMRIKARYIYAVGVGDYRPLYKANV